MRKILSIDAETDGLWGDPFALAAIVYEDGVETARLCGRLPDDQVHDPWVLMYVLPTLGQSDGLCPITHENYSDFMSDFADFYKKHKEGAEVICHMGYIVEAHLFRELRALGYLGDWDAPYPLFDVSGNLQQAGFDPTSVDSYAKEFKLEVSDYGTTHNPLYDAEVAAKVYMHLTRYVEFPVLQPTDS